MHATQPRGTGRILLGAVAARRWYVVGGAIVGALAGVLLSLVTPASYAATVEVVVSPVPGATSASASEAMQLAEQVVSSAEVRDAVRLERTLITSPPAVRFTSSGDQGTARLRVQDADPEVATQLVAAYAQAGDRALRASSGLSLNMIGTPTRPVDPVGPSPARNAGLGLLVGLAVGTGLALLRDRRDVAVRPGVDVEGLTGLPILGHIPKLAATEDGRPISARANRCDESFKSLATSIERLGGDRRLRIVQILSPESGCGSSTIATGLAIAMGIAGRDVVLVDGDVREPSQHTMLHLPLKPGLLNATSVDAANVMLHSISRRLEVVTAGGTAPAPADFLATRSVGQFLKFATENGELAVLDTHGVFPRRDALGAVRHVEGVVIVVRSGKTMVPTLVSTVEAIVAAGGRPLGVVLNGVGRRAYRGSRHRLHDGPPLVDVESGVLADATPSPDISAPIPPPPVMTPVGSVTATGFDPPTPEPPTPPPPPPPTVQLRPPTAVQITTNGFNAANSGSSTAPAALTITTSSPSTVEAAPLAEAGPLAEAMSRVDVARLPISSVPPPPPARQATKPPPPPLAVPPPPAPPR